MTDEQIRKRHAEILASEMLLPLRWFYLSFATDERGFLGCVYVQARGVAHASARAHAMGINPGGQMLAIELPADSPLPAESGRNRLLTRAELEKYLGPVKKLGEMTEEERNVIGL